MASSGSRIGSVIDPDTLSLLQQTGTIGVADSARFVGHRSPEGRICRISSCEVVLSTYNDEDVCVAHARALFAEKVAFELLTTVEKQRIRRTADKIRAYENSPKPPIETFDEAVLKARRFWSAWAR